MAFRTHVLGALVERLRAPIVIFFIFSRRSMVLFAASDASLDPMSVFFLLDFCRLRDSSAAVIC